MSKTSKTSLTQKRKALTAIGLAATATAAVLVWTGLYGAGIPVAEASSRPGYQGEAEYNAFDKWDVAPNIYLPFVGSDPAWGWRTATTVQNTCTDTITITLRYFNTSGAEVSIVTDTLPPLGSRVYTPTGVFSGSLLISATQDIGAIATDSPLDSNREGDSLMSYRGVERWDGGVEISLLPIYRGYQGWNSRFAIQNTEDTTTPITITFYDLTGTAVYSQVDSLPPRSAHLYSAAEVSGLGTDFYGRAQVETGNSERVAGAVKAVNSQTGEAVAHNNHRLEPTSAPYIFLPLVMRRHTSSIVVYNTGATEVTSNTITLYDQDGITVTTYGPFSLEAHASRSVSLNDPGWSPAVSVGFKGSARVYRGSHHINALVDTTWPSTPGTFTGYSGVDWGNAPSYVPFVSNSADGGVTQISVQNIEGAEAEVVVTYYDGSGSQAGRETATVNPYAAHYFDQAASGLPASFSGSAVVTSTHSIVVTGLISRGQLNLIYLPLVLRN
jgi:hypothetical protein